MIPIFPCGDSITPEALYSFNYGTGPARGHSKPDELGSTADKHMFLQRYRYNLA